MVAPGSSHSSLFTAHCACDHLRKEVVYLKEKLRETEMRNVDLQRGAQLWERIAMSREEETARLRQTLREWRLTERDDVCFVGRSKQ